MALVMVVMFFEFPLRVHTWWIHFHFAFLCVCEAWAQNTNLFFTHILENASSYWSLSFINYRRIAVGSTIWFYAPFSVSCFGGTLVWIFLDNHKLVENTLSVGWSSLKRGFPQQPFPFSCIFKKSPKCHENSSHSFAAVPTSHFCHNWVPCLAILVLTAAGTRTPSLEDTSIINEHTWPFRKSQTVWILDNNAHHRKQLTFVRFL